MIRGRLLGLIVPSLLLLTVLFAQPDLCRAAGELPDLREQQPDFSARTVSGEAVVDLADFIAGYVAETGTIPDLAQVATMDGGTRSLTAAEAFVLLARTTYLWEFGGALPESVPISPDDVKPPVLDPQDVVFPPDPEVGREVSTEQFLGQCASVVRWVDRLRVVPTAVWVDGERLSSAEYMAGLAICISYAYWEGGLLDSVFLSAYAPPQAWGGNQEAAYYADESAGDYSTDSSSEYTDEAYAGEEAPAEDQAWTNAPLSVGPAPRAEQAMPELMIYPQPGETVSGVVDVIAGYSGPRERFVTFTIDGRSEIIMNFPPYSYRWDTRALEPGAHTVRIQVFGNDKLVLADQTTAFMVAATPETSSAETPDDL
jgi:hypothetical protein